ncbi:hypothetical protein CARUB_v10027809mg [Capsella rubella]|uniref:Phorbol-ester/DAG-type domain-containing protein n=1 Tax=Capsella rubella TaxID=81985 RepID=R0EV24_9BRAS|nr:hypothetical protein CARUB_v10027809mg [Capsella rubella]
MDTVVEVRVAIHHHHLMTPSKDGRMGNCCGIKFESITDGYSCTQCKFYAHKICSNPPEEINHPSHRCKSSLSLRYNNERFKVRCGLCGGKIEIYIKHYNCRTCDLKIHLGCAKYHPPATIHVPQSHDHELKLELMERCFTCASCGKEGDEYPYKCHECELSFHLFKGEPPKYTDGKCRLCGDNLVDDEVFYHCSTCNFSLDLHCVHYPPPLHLHDLNIHDHELILKPKQISFTCTTCGLIGDRSPYFCLQCDFVAHNDCSGFPWVININRHNHRVSRTSLLGVVDAVCGVCRKKMEWTCGGYSCERCRDNVFHTKCATREDVWDGLEMKDEPEEDEDIEPFEVIDENTIQHFSHREHNLRLNKSGIFIEEKSCKACTYPIYHHSFFNCMSCNFFLHESCAKLPRRKRHVLSNKPYILSTKQANYSQCEACGVFYNGFMYHCEKNRLDVRCASVPEPFVHQSHPEHPLFYMSPLDGGVCSACNEESSHVLRCVEDNCGFILDFKCALLPYAFKHRVDDHFLSLCYGENARSGKYWCDICEKETDPKTWFYTCKDCGVTLHINCVLGDFRGLEPKRRFITKRETKTTPYEAVRNNSMSRPLCSRCKSRCIFPTILKTDFYVDSDIYCCSITCSTII